MVLKADEATGFFFNLEQPHLILFFFFLYLNCILYSNLVLNFFGRAPGSYYIVIYCRIFWLSPWFGRLGNHCQRYKRYKIKLLTYFFWQINVPHCLKKLEVSLVFNSFLIIFRQFIFSFVRFGNTSSNTTLNKH